MGYAHGTQWTDELVKSEIEKVMNALGIKRMPSRAEIESVTGNSGLSARISKTGGFYKWADKLTLDIKESESELSIMYESICKEYIESKFGLKAELTSVKFPYDVFVGTGVKIDVKVSRLYEGPNGSFYTANLAYKLPKCDFIVMYCIDGSIQKVYVIPSIELVGINQLSIGEVTSKYDKFLGRWDLIKRFDELIDAFKTNY